MRLPFKLPFLKGKGPAPDSPDSLDGPVASAARQPSVATADDKAAPVKKKGLPRKTLLLLAGGVGAVVLLGALGGGGWWWYKTSRPEHAVEQLVLAFRTGDAKAFESRVDVDGLTDALLAFQLQASGARGLSAPDAAEKARLRDMLRQSLLALPAGAAGEQKREDILPPNFREQVGASAPAIEERGDGRVVVGMPVKNEMLETTFHLRVELRDGKGGWKVTGVVEPERFMAEHEAALERLRAKDRAAFEAENARIGEQLADMVRLDKTLVGIDRLSGSGNFRVLVVQVNGQNVGGQTLGRIVVDCAVLDEAGRELRTLKLVRSNQLLPGASFTESWVIDLDEAEPKDVPLLNAERLSARASMRSVVLSTGESIVIKGK